MTAPCTKSQLRKSLRAARVEHVADLAEAVKGLVFHRPPAPILANIAPGAVIGLYHAVGAEAPADNYARFFHEAGHTIALPHFAAIGTAMQFRQYSDPHGGSDLSAGPFGMVQPSADAAVLTPDVLFVPLVGFTADLARLGQGGGHYDRWLAEHPGRMAIGLAWDVQLVEALPVEPHDAPLDAVVTPTRIYGLN
ncbi:5-formyltetrahydrofolate cyclo-ligase [Qipengyuania sp. ASV99]|uniref:5-formyltetrahydrofolate cyclo-ligase n=1 Tax=Qipengyuania sp. ASV99 TaxID=3399681 RepID=UPI003A4C74DB